MIRNADLFTMATSGLNASQKLLNTTSNNIANINTEGYVRERTEFTSRLGGGVDFGFTDRVLDVFAQNQLRRDTSSVGEFEAFNNRVESLDNILATEANSISSALTRFFASIQTATDDPTNMPSRDAVLGEAQSMLNRINTLGDFMRVKEEETELQIENTVSTANRLIEQIGDLNEAIQVAQGSSTVDTPSALLNQRDLAVMELSELVAIEVRQSSNADDGIVINLKSGESLVLADGAFNVFAIGGEPDYTSRDLKLQTNYQPPKQNTTINVREQSLGGALGGVYKYREQVLEPAQRDLGKLATTLADTLNTQNRQGMDLDLQLGGDLFTIADFRGINYPENADLSVGVTGRLRPGESGDLTNNDYKITVLTAPTGNPATFDVEVAALTNESRPQLDENNNPITQTLTVTAQAGTYNATIGGIEITFDDGGNYAVGDAFLIQPTRIAAANLTMATTRAEDLAFAKPLRLDTNIDNLGDAKLIGLTISNSFVDNSFVDSRASAFNGDFGLQDASESPSATFGAPVTVRFSSADTYDVLDNSGQIISTVSGASDLNNLLAQAKQSGTPAWPPEFSALDDYPGYDFSLEGIPKPGDEFTFDYNTNGINDNRNAYDLASLQQGDFVRLSNGTQGNKATFNEAYSSLVSQVGSASAASKIDLEAAKIMQTQSSDWFESSAGVSLDEEAANLIQFQQSYAAAARILSTAQQMFDTILQVSR
ncbi:flagellar hook-associated protein FlgK [Glaciecola petra]|uniref:Flagellar hook-associated protein 1 n=1 Tax=Glaciecola petra TaxID=3075602 RepID=A0ABU2ZME0_9ALTE|nr:flagellar hook-associated protein FlgK [Aestuariibacter sp. P117]MDT0593792.1 flagellar hook-associated protein FlgK [Aestuariibacter sp. P117]